MSPLYTILVHDQGHCLAFPVNPDLVLCMAWCQAKSQAKPSQMVWPGGGFGFQKSRPSHKARAFVELFLISRRWGLDSNAILTTITCIYYIIKLCETATQSMRSGSSVSSTSSSTLEILIWPCRTYINHIRKNQDACKKIWLMSKWLLKEWMA